MAEPPLTGKKVATWGAEGCAKRSPTSITSSIEFRLRAYAPWHSALRFRPPRPSVFSGGEGGSPFGTGGRRPRKPAARRRQTLFFRRFPKPAPGSLAEATPGPKIHSRYGFRDRFTAPVLRRPSQYRSGGLEGQEEEMTAGALTHLRLARKPQDRPRTTSERYDAGVQAAHSDRGLRSTGLSAGAIDVRHSSTSARLIASLANGRDHATAPAIFAPAIRGTPQTVSACTR